MASTLQQYHQLADHMATQITGSYQSWTDFLTTAARLYKYPYLESVFMVDGRDDLTEQEKKKINAQCNQLRAKCL